MLHPITPPEFNISQKLSESIALQHIFLTKKYLLWLKLFKLSVFTFPVKEVHSFHGSVHLVTAFLSTSAGIRSAPSFLRRNSCGTPSSPFLCPVELSVNVPCLASQTSTAPMPGSVHCHLVGKQTPNPLQLTRLQASDVLQKQVQSTQIRHC